VSPNDRDRPAGESRHQTRQAVRALRALEVRRNKQVLAVIAAMVVVIGGFVGLSLALNKDTKAVTISQAGATATAGPSAQVSAPATAAAVPKPLVAGCSVAPKLPADQRTGTLPDKATAAGKTFVATVTTNCGVLTMELDGTKAPQTVASFLGLAKSGYWADSPCHRLTTAGIFVLQCGDPTGTGSGSPGYGFGVENPPADFIFAPGTLAMARTPDPNTNGGQFFVVYKGTRLPDAVGYSIFGKVTSGMDIVDKIAAAGAAPADATQNTAPRQPISILTVNVAEKKA